MIALRNNNDIFINGDFESLYIDDDVYAFKRSLNDKNAVILINPSDKKKDIFISALNISVDINAMSGLIIK